MKGDKVFVTVGTTKFDNLINTVTSDDILQELGKKGYTEITLQIGNTSIVPDITPRCGFKLIKAFNLSPSIHDFMESADLIISHGGVGCIMEALELKKPIIVVVNDLLMDNHQLELAQQLFNDGYLYFCDCKNLRETIKNKDLSALKPFTVDKSKEIAKVINKIMGF